MIFITDPFRDDTIALNELLVGPWGLSKALLILQHLCPETPSLGSTVLEVGGV